MWDQTTISPCTYLLPQKMVERPQRLRDKLHELSMTARIALSAFAPCRMKIILPGGMNTFATVTIGHTVNKKCFAYARILASRSFLKAANPMMHIQESLSESKIGRNISTAICNPMLVLEFALDRQQIDINPMRNSWLNRAGQSLAEALRLAVCQELDIEFTELVTGYRVRQNRAGDFVDIYLYDSLSSGAGYAVSIESSIRQLLTKTRELLDGCTCDSACHRCLKHYRNQHIHNVLDRKAALDLLNWGETGTRASAISCENQRHLLKSLKQILQLSGVRIDVSHETVWAEGCYGKKKVIVYPAMWTKPVEENTIFVSDVYLKYAKPYALKTIVDSL